MFSQETKADRTLNKASIFDELRAKDPEMPDFSNLPEKERMKAEEKWFMQNIGVGIPKNYLRFMDRLEKEVKLPSKDSKYVGIWRRSPDHWGILEEKEHDELALSSDGTFTFEHATRCG